MKAGVDLQEASFVAVDLGASGGRVVRGRFGADEFELEPIHRFPNEARRDGDELRWSTRELLAEIKASLAWIARSGARVKSVGVDAWGGDYGLLDGAGALLEEPIAGAGAGVASSTLFRLRAHVHGGRWPAKVARLLPMPDLFHHELCGSDVGEATHASTMQMVRHDTGDWDHDLVRRLGIPSTMLPKLVAPGTRLGWLRPAVARDVGLPQCEVVAPAAHDAASTVAGTPLAEGVACVSVGAASFVGVERHEPLVSDEAALEQFTNERGVAGTFRFVKPAAGGSILEGCRNSWRAEGRDLGAAELDAAIARAPAWAGVIAPDAPHFQGAGDMAAAVRRFLRESRQPAPDDPGTLARIVLESLALHWAGLLQTLARLTGRELSALRIVGGGSQDEFLNQTTADVTGLEVLAGPVEATAIGNLLVQAITAGRFRDLAEGRAYVAQVLPALRFPPRDPRGAPRLVDRLRNLQLSGSRAARD